MIVVGVDNLQPDFLTAGKITDDGGFELLPLFASIHDGDFSGQLQTPDL